MSKKKKHQKNNLLAYNPLELTANALDWLNKNDSISKLLRKWTILYVLILLYSHQKTSPIN